MWGYRRISFPLVFLITSRLKQQTDHWLAQQFLNDDGANSADNSA
jgi:hypothetical protein